MVPITKGQMVKGDETLVVVSDDGQYGDTDLMLCASAEAPDTPIVMLAAQFVAYGPIVYQYNTPEELGKAVYAIDPTSTLDAVALYREDEMRRRARNAGTLEPENPVPAPDAAVEPPADTVASDIEQSTQPAEDIPLEDAAVVPSVSSVEAAVPPALPTSVDLSTNTTAPAVSAQIADPFTIDTVATDTASTTATQ